MLCCFNKKKIILELCSKRLIDTLQYFLLLFLFFIINFQLCFLEAFFFSVYFQVARWCSSLRFIYSIYITHFFLFIFFDVTRTNWKLFTHSHNLTLRSMDSSHQNDCIQICCFDAFKVHTIHWKCHTKKCMMPVWYGAIVVAFTVSRYCCWRCSPTKYCVALPLFSVTLILHHSPVWV